MRSNAVQPERRFYRVCSRACLPNPRGGLTLGNYRRDKAFRADAGDSGHAHDLLRGRHCMPSPSGQGPRSIAPPDPRADSGLYRPPAMIPALLDPVQPGARGGRSHAQLGWIFNCVAGGLGWGRMSPSGRTGLGKNAENASLGLFAYPALMAADILL